MNAKCHLNVRTIYFTILLAHFCDITAREFCSGLQSTNLTSCRRAGGRHDMPPPRPAMEARSGSLEPGRPSRARSANTRHPAGRPHTPPAAWMYATDVRQTNVRQHHRLMPPGRGITTAEFSWNSRQWLTSSKLWLTLQLTRRAAISPCPAGRPAACTLLCPPSSSCGPAGRLGLGLGSSPNPAGVAPSAPRPLTGGRGLLQCCPSPHELLSKWSSANCRPSGESQTWTKNKDKQRSQMQLVKSIKKLIPAYVIVLPLPNLNKAAMSFKWIYTL